MRTAVVLFLTFLLFTANVSAQRTTDAEGSKDYSLVSRFKGSVIEWYLQKNFDRYFILDLKDNKISNFEIDGAVTRIQYSVGNDHSVFEISKSYESALKESGFEMITVLDEKNCGVNLQEYVYNKEFNGLNALPPEAHKPDYNENFSYLAAKKKIQGKEIYVVVFTTNQNYPLVTFDAIEVRLMDEDLVTVKSLDENIADTGHMAVYGIYFDSGRSEIKDGSKEALSSIAEYLKSKKDAKYLVVGHTDNTGNFDANLKLSLERAKSVINELVSKYGISAAQLKAYGDGSTAPVASNKTEEGRGKNRRVEIVLQ